MAFPKMERKWITHTHTNEWKRKLKTETNITKTVAHEPNKVFFECDNNVIKINNFLIIKVSTNRHRWNRTLTLAQYSPLLHFDCESVLSMASICFFVMAFDCMVFEEQDFVLHLIAQNHAVARNKYQLYSMCLGGKWAQRVVRKV